MSLKKREEKLQEWLNNPRSDCSYDTLLDVLCSLVYDLAFAAKTDVDHISKFLSRFQNVVEKVQNLRTNIKDFTRIKLLKRGHFGEVILVRHKSTRMEMAMQKLDKALLRQRNLDSQRTEKELLQKIDSDWIVKLYCTFLDSQYLYICMEHLPGGSVADWLANIDIIPEAQAAFYLAEMTLCVDALHSFGYAHCSLRPEVFMLDSNGHLKLTDFLSALPIGSVKQIFYDDEADLKLLRHPHYCCPELLTDPECIVTVGWDWWSIGVILFEMVFGQPAFIGENDITIYDQIVNFRMSSFKFPQSVALTNETKNIIQSFLTDQNNRLGCNGLKEITCHPFFVKFRKDWTWETIRSSVTPQTPFLYSRNRTSEDDRISRRFTSFERCSLRPFTLENLEYVGFSCDLIQENKNTKPTNNIAFRITEFENFEKYVERLEIATELIELDKIELMRKCEKQQDTIELLQQYIFVKERRIDDLWRSLQNERQKQITMLTTDFTAKNDCCFHSQDEILGLDFTDSISSLMRGRPRSTSDNPCHFNMHELSSYFKEITKEKFQYEDECHSLKSELMNNQALLKISQDKCRSLTLQLNRCHAEMNGILKINQLKESFFEKEKSSLTNEIEELRQQLEETRSKCSTQDVIIERLQEEVSSLNKDKLSFQARVYFEMRQLMSNQSRDCDSYKNSPPSPYMDRLAKKLEIIAYRAEESKKENDSLLKHISNLRRNLQKERQLRISAEEDLKRGEAWVDYLLKGNCRQNQVDISEDNGENKFEASVSLWEWNRNQESKTWTQRFAQVDSKSLKLYVSKEVYQNNSKPSLVVPLEKIIHIRNANKLSLNTTLDDSKLINIMELIYDAVDIETCISTQKQESLSVAFRWQGHLFKRVYLRLMPVMCQVCHRSCADLFDPPESLQCAQCHIVVHAGHVKNKQKFPACKHAVCCELIRFSSEEEKTMWMQFIHLKKHRLSTVDGPDVKSLSTCECSNDFSDYCLL